jgi:hypothetical protein
VPARPILYGSLDASTGAAMLASIIFNVFLIAVMVWCGRFTAK